MRENEKIRGFGRMGELGSEEKKDGRGFLQREKNEELWRI